ncbi:acyl carrier protein [Streptomyces sp. NPDC002644]
MAVPTIETIRETVRSQLATTLFCEPAEIADDTPFEDLGLDSVLGVELIGGVNAAYGLEEKVAAVYENPTVEQFSAHVRQQLAQRQAP